MEYWILNRVQNDKWEDSARTGSSRCMDLPDDECLRVREELFGAVVFFADFLVEVDFDEGLVGDVFFVGKDFEAVEQRFRYSDGNGFGREFEIGEGDIDAF